MSGFSLFPSGRRVRSAFSISVVILVFLTLSGCGGSSSSGGGGSNPIVVSATASSTTIDGSDTSTLTATVTNDSTNSGVTWTAPTLGSLSSLTAAAPTYTAPAATNAAQSVTLTATSVADKTKSSSVTLTVPAAPAITTTSLPATTAGAAYSATLAGSGGISPYTWKLTGGTLPAGMSLNSGTGVISAAAGTTAATPSTSLIFTMTDSGSPTALTATATLSLTINPIPVIGVSVTSSSTTVDGNDTATLTATVTNDSTNSGVTWTAPALGSLSSLTALSPTYTAPVATTSAQTVTLKATSVADSTKSSSVTLTVPAAPTISTSSLPAATAGAAYSATLAGSGGIAPYMWKLTGGTLPTGMSLNSSTGVISAAAGATVATPSTSLTFELTDAGTPTALTATAALNLTINAALSGQIYGSILFPHPATVCPAPDQPLVSVSINTNPVQTTTANAKGNFTFANIPYGTYTITPSLPGTNALFTPVTQSVTVDSSGVETSFQAGVGYSISGTVNYSGTETGPIYLALESFCPYGTGVTYLYYLNSGTGILAPGPFTINGVGPGTYTIQAFRDNLHDGAPNGTNPTGSVAGVSISSANATGVSITLTDPAPVTFSYPPAAPQVTPFDQGAVIVLQIIYDFTNTIGLGEEASSYTLQWSTNNTFATIDGSKSYPALGAGNNTRILTGLTDGQVLYFREQAVAGSATSPWSSVSGPFTIGASTGPITVSGNVNFPVAAAGPLYITFTNAATNSSFVTAIASPVSPQPYTIQLPADGQYTFNAFIDQNNDNALEGGDLTLAGPVYTTAVAGSTTTQDITMSGGGPIGAWSTVNNQYVGSPSGSSQQYGISFSAESGSKQLVAVELVSGPNAIPVQDFTPCTYMVIAEICGQFNLYGNAPQVGDTYGLLLTYSDGSQETLSEKVSGVVGSFGASPSPAGVGADLTPNFSWTDPADASDYGYLFDLSSVYATGPGGIGWFIPGNGWGPFSSSIDSIAWGVDPTGSGSVPSAPSLTSGADYKWYVSARDSNGNSSQLNVFYYPGYTGVYLPAANPATPGPATVGQGYIAAISATNGTAPYTFIVSGLSDGMSYSVSGETVTISGTPTAAGTITFQVTVQDSLGNSWGPVIYTINVGAA